MSGYSFRRFVAGIVLLVAAAQLPAQAVQVYFGYVASVEKGEFELKGHRIHYLPVTQMGMEKDKGTSNNGALLPLLRPGAYVTVVGVPVGEVVNAQSIRFRDELARTLSGAGVVEKVLAREPELLVLADGYRIRIPAQTAPVLDEGIASVRQIEPNHWIAYEGRMGSDGVLVAGKVRFGVPKPGKVKAVKFIDGYTLKYSIENCQAEKRSGKVVQLNTPTFYTLGTPAPRSGKFSSDCELQQRILQIGERLIPAYQRALPADDPTKINFQFFAYEDKKNRVPVVTLDGMVLIPTPLLDRLQNDDQLAALLADGVAFHLQRQAARIITANRSMLTAQAVGDVIGLFVPGVSLLALAGNAVASNSVYNVLNQQRARVALALMAEAGYDPWQAPESWRRLAPKQWPPKKGVARMPEFGLYQLGMLNLQYPKPPAPVSVPAQ